MRSQMTVGGEMESGTGGEGEAKVVGEEPVGSGRSCGGGWGRPWVLFGRPVAQSSESCTLEEVDMRSTGGKVGTKACIAGVGKCLKEVGR